jgi:hypothetical protein
VTRSGPIPKPRRGERQAVKQHEKRQADLEAAAAKRAWGAAVGKTCAMCRREPVSDEVREDFFNDLVKIEGHHLIPKGDLKALGIRPRERYDLRLKVDLCRYHHERHENFVEGARVPADMYGPGVYAYAEQHDVMWLLERERDAG